MIKRRYKPRTKVGSALILTVVLTSMLAIVGMMFVMAARVDKMSTSAISENKELNFAVETIVAKLSQELILDVPGAADPNLEQEYYDYPDEKNAWLASLEPYEDGLSDYRWRQISDVYSKLSSNEDLLAEIIPDYQDSADVDEDKPADADGDGVADSKWIELDDMTSGKGRPIYAAIRVIDNGGMLNVNTAYKFDPDGNLDEIDGRSQMQINLMALSWRLGTTLYNALDETDLLDARANDGFGGINPLDLDEYERNVIWRYNEPNRPYTPFDISDELELRNRFLINHPDIDTRLEEWGGEFRNNWTSSTPFRNVTEWFISAYDDGWLDPNYAYRHLATTYNMDRIIDPDGGKMVWVNDPNAIASTVFNAIKGALDSIDFADWVIQPQAQRDAVAAQLAVNIADYVDGDLGVQTYDVGGVTYYGFEAQPFITEIGIKIAADPLIAANNHFAVELYNPFNVDIPLDDFKLVLDGSGRTVSFNVGDVITANSYYVVVNHGGQFAVVDDKVDNDLVLADNYAAIVPPIYTCNNYDILLTRDVAGPTIYVDRQDTDNSWFTQASGTRYLERDDNGGHILYQDVFDIAGGSIGVANSHTAVGLGGKFNLLPFGTTRFVTVGDVARMLIIGPSENKDETVGKQLADGANLEEDIRVDLENPDFRNIFQYLTVFDPSRDNIDNDGDGVPDNGKGEWKVPGRININTAPWYVIAQLPWMRLEIAQAIVAYRDKESIAGIDYSSRKTATGINNLREAEGFESIGELTTVINDFGQDNYDMHYYTLGPENGIDLDGFPDLTPGGSTGDGAEDDFEERDVIFARISNLVTVRSDVFTAYILVRIGADGPQKRAVTILDRSDVYSAEGRVRVRALHPVPDPR